MKIYAIRQNRSVQWITYSIPVYRACTEHSGASSAAIEQHSMPVQNHLYHSLLLFSHPSILWILKKSKLFFLPSWENRLQNGKSIDTIGTDFTVR